MNIPRDKFSINKSLHSEKIPKLQGGLHTKGYFKTNYKEKPLISIITVVLNGEKQLDRTIQSILNQTYNNIEYIIIDGGSIDRTSDIINKYKETIDYWVSEKDDGLYDAMNKGIDIATGEWINFMNAGDEFYNYSVLTKLFNNKNYKETEIIYGNHQIIYSSGSNRYVKAGSTKNIWKGEQFSHQSSFVKKSYLKMNKFNHRNKIASDFELYYKAFKNYKKFQFIDLTIAKFEAGGVSDVKRINSIFERWGIVEKTLKNYMYYCMLIVKEILKIIVKRFV
jgi:glycosyltransferase involved in cell wall biosynthesis